MSTIGLFDSGVGGLSVWREVRRILPNANLIYVADQKYCPYGSRPRDEIIARARHITAFLLAQHCDVIIVACNTASAAALADLRGQFPGTPFVGMEPAIKPAAQLTRAAIIGVLATEGTLRGDLFSRTRAKYAQGVQVIVTTAPGLVEQIERGKVDSPETRFILRRALDPLVGAGADVLVLGCTHYPFVALTIHDLFGDSLRVIDPSAAVARQTARILRVREEIRIEDRTGAQFFYTSGDPSEFARVLAQLMGIRAQVAPME